MKNLSLFGILILLLSITYFFEELKTEKEEVKKVQDGLVFDFKPLGEMVGIETKTFSLKKSQKSYVVGAKKRRVDRQKLEKVLDILGALKLKRVLQKNELNELDKSLFEGPTLSFFLEKGKVRFTLGKKLPLDQSFYLTVEGNKQKKVIIAYDSSVEKEIYDPRTQFKSKEKYLRILSILNLPESFFYDHYIFGERHYLSEKKGWKYIKISNNRNKAFGVSFEDMTTDPEPFKGVKELPSAIRNLSDRALNLRATQVIETFSRKDLKEPVAALFLKGMAGGSEELQLYRQLDEQVGYFVSKKGENIIYEIGKESSSIFFTHIQQFWKKNLQVPLNDVSFVFVNQKGKEFKLFKNSSPFEVSGEDSLSKKLGPSNTKFKNLFSFLLKEASFIIEGPPNLDSLFSLKFKNFMLSFYHLNREIIVYNHNNELSFHYLINAEVPFSLNSQDYFLNN